MRARVGGFVVAVALAVALAAGPAAAAGWRFETLAGGGNPDLGTAAVQFGGRPHVFSHSAGEGLRHLWWTGSTWRSEVLDGTTSTYAGHTATTNIGMRPMALLVGGSPQVWYLDSDAGNLHHAWWNGSTWRFELVDGPNATTQNHATQSLFLAQSQGRAFLYNGRPQLVYVYPSGANRSLRSAIYGGTGWFLFSIDGGGSPYPGAAQAAGDWSDVTFFNGLPHVFTVASNSFGVQFVHHAWWDGKVWKLEVLDGTGSAYAGATSDNVGINGVAAASYQGAPHVWYQDFATGALRHAWWTGTTWRFEVLDGTSGRCVGATASGATVGLFPQAAVFGGQLHVFHYRTTSSPALRHVWWNGSQWRCEVLDGTASPFGAAGATQHDVGRNVALLSGSQLDAWYQDSDAHTLRHAWFG